MQESDNAPKHVENQGDCTAPLMNEETNERDTDVDTMVQTKTFQKQVNKIYLGYIMRIRNFRTPLTARKVLPRRKRRSLITPASMLEIKMLLLLR